MKVSGWSKIWNWLKGKFSKIGKKAEEALDRQIDRIGSNIIDRGEKYI